MKKNKKIIILSLFIILIAAGIFIFLKFYNPKKAINLILPDLSEITFINANIVNDSAHIKVNMIAQNKSPYKITIDSVYFEVKLDSHQLFEELVALNLKQIRFQVDTISLPINISKKKFKSVIGNLQGTDSTSLQINCYVIYNTIFGHYKLKYDKVVHISVPIPPEIKVIKVEQKEYSIKNKTLQAMIHLEIINKGKKIDIRLMHIKYQFKVKNSLSSDGIINKPVRIKPASTTYLEIPVSVKIEHPLKTAMAILTDNDQMQYTLHLQAEMIENMTDNKLKRKPFPVEVDALGMIELKK